jgi:hypothetical protein
MNPQLEELACLYVLDQLDVRERAAFAARLLHDPGLAELVRTIESTHSRLIRALPRRGPAPGILERLEERIDLLPHGGDRRRTPAVLWKSVARWGIAAVIAAGVGTLALQSLRRSSASAAPAVVIVVGLDSGGGAPVELPLGGRPRDADARFIQLASLAERFWEKPDDLPMKGVAAAGSGRGYALFDPGSNQGFIAIRQLPAAQAGMRYHLWIRDTASGRVREAGVLPSSGSAPGLYFFTVAPAAGTPPVRLDFFVTEEDTSAEPGAPHGRVVLGDRSI